MREYMFTRDHPVKSEEKGSDMKTRAVAMLAAILAVHQCGAPAGKDAGGDNNPSTGACTLAFEETTSDGVHHRYPEFVNPELRLIAGKVIFFCERPPTLHNATAALEKRRLGAGAQWTSADKQESSSRRGGTGGWRCPQR